MFIRGSVKVEELKELISGCDDLDMVDFHVYCHSKECYIVDKNIHVNVRKPKPTEFKHTECTSCKIVNDKWLHCELHDEMINIMYENNCSCSDFNHVRGALDFLD